MLGGLLALTVAALFTGVTTPLDAAETASRVLLIEWRPHTVRALLSAVATLVFLRAAA